MTGHVDRTRPGRAEPEGGPVVEPRPGRAARLGGVLYLVTFASSIPAVLLLAPVLDRVGFVTESGSDVRVLVGCLLDVVNALACVGTAVALWPVVRRTHPTLALGFLASRIIEGAVIMIGVVCLLGVVTLRRDVGGAGSSLQVEHRPVGGQAAVDGQLLGDERELPVGVVVLPAGHEEHEWKREHDGGQRCDPDDRREDPTPHRNTPLRSGISLPSVPDAA